MAKNFSQLAGDLESFAQDTRLLGGEAVRHTALAIGDAVGESTPVDTGAARSNWIMSIGAHVLGLFFPAYFPGKKLGRSERSNLNAMRHQHLEALSAFDPKKDSVIFLTNATPYLADLNEGTPGSRQTAPRFIEASLIAGDQGIVTAVGGMKNEAPF